MASLVLMVFAVLGLFSLPPNGKAAVTTSFASLSETPFTASSASQREISLHNLTELLTILERAKYEAHHSYNITCGRMSNYCDKRRERALKSDIYPSFEVRQTDDVQDQTKNMYLVIIRFSDLIGLFADDVRSQVVSRGLRDSSEYESLNSLNTSLSWMRYVSTKLRQLIPEVAWPSSSPRIDDDPDVSTRNNKNIAITARAARELGKMSNNLQAVICARNPSVSGC